MCILDHNDTKSIVGDQDELSQDSLEKHLSFSLRAKFGCSKVGTPDRH